MPLGMLYYLVADWVGSACLTEVASGENFEFCRGLLLVAFFAVDVKLAIGYVLLEEDRTAFSAGIYEPDFYVVVLGESPLATIAGISSFSTVPFVNRRRYSL